MRDMKRRGFFGVIAGALGLAKLGAPADLYFRTEFYPFNLVTERDAALQREINLARRALMKFSRLQPSKGPLTTMIEAMDKVDVVECPSCKRTLEFAHIENRQDPHLDFWCGSCAVSFRDEKC